MQKKIKIWLPILILFSVLNSHAQDTSAVGNLLTLQQCVDIAIKNNLLVRTSETTMESNKVLLNQSRDYLLPSIGAYGNQGTGFGRNLNPYTYTYVDQQIITGQYYLNSNLTLFSGLQVLNSIKQYGYAYDASKMDLQQQKDNITLSVILAYLQILGSRDLLVISREQADVDAKQLSRLEILNNAGGLLLLSDLSNLKGQYAGDQVNIATAVNNLESAKINLFQVLNIPYKKDVQYEAIPAGPQLPVYETNSDSIYQTALLTLPIIKSADLRIKSYKKALQATRGQYFPTLSFYGSLNTSYSNAATINIPGNSVQVATADYVTVSGTNYNVITKQQNFTTQNISFGDQFKNNRFTSIGLQLSVPILNSFRARNNVKQAKINLKIAENNANSTRLVLQQNVELAFQNMITSYSQLKSYQDQVLAYAESFRTTEIRFNEGVVNSDIYVLAKNNIDRANINLAQAKYNYIFRTKILDYYQGRLALQ
ncbi:MAG TPA: TolC family protein [Puia sp.]|nr:TolC family protein [Puia sp.]